MDLLLQGLQLPKALQQAGVHQLHFHFQRIQVIALAHHQLVVGAHVFHAHQHAFNLAGEHVDALDDEHIVGAAHNFIHAHMGAAAGAGLVVQAGDVLGAVAQHRHALAGECCHHQLAHLPGGLLLQGVLVDDFRQESVLGEVEAAAQVALAGDTGAGELGHAVVIRDGDAQVLLNALAHLLGAALAAQNAVLQAGVGLFGVGAFPDQLAQVQGIAGGGHQAGDAEVPQHHQLLFGVARGGGDDGGAHLLQAKVQAQGAGEQAVAKGDLDDVVAGDAAGGDDAGHEIGPVFNVLFGVGAHRGLARGARGGVDAHDVLHGHGQHAEGVVIPDVVLGGEGDVLDVRQGFNLIPAGDAGLAQALVVEGDVVVAVVHHPLEAPQLQGFNIRPLHGFYVFLEKPGFHWCSDLPSRGSPGGFGRFGFVLVNRESALVYCTGNGAVLQVFLHKGDRALFSFGGRALCQRECRALA